MRENTPILPASHGSAVPMRKRKRVVVAQPAGAASPRRRPAPDQSLHRNSAVRGDGRFHILHRPAVRSEDRAPRPKHREWAIHSMYVETGLAEAALTRLQAENDSYEYCLVEDAP